MQKLFATIILLLLVSRLFAETPVQRPARQIGFVENKGPFRDQHGNPNPDVLYMADFGGMKVQLRRDGFSYEVYQVKPKWVDPALQSRRQCRSTIPLPVSALPPGIYLLSVAQGNHREVVKVVR